jgi:putative redox protein
MASTIPPNPPAAQAVVAGGIDTDTLLTGRAGAVEFLVGGASELGGSASGPNPYDLLSASLAACTAMTIRLQARHRKYPLSHVELAVSYHHSGSRGRGSFERAITLEGALNDDQRAQLLRGADTCPVGRTLGIGAQIHTHSGDEAHLATASRPANYAQDLEAFSIINIDPD